MAEQDVFDAYEQSLESLYSQADASAGLTLAGSRLRKRNMILLRRRSLQLAQFLDGDFTSIMQEMRRAFPGSYRNMPTRIYPILQRVVHDLATLYARDPQRFFQAAAGGKLDQSQYQKFRDVYDRSDVNSALLQGSRQLIPQQTQVFAVLPAGPRQLTLKAFSPYETFVTPGNALIAHDIRTAKEVRIRAAAGASDDTVVLGWLVFNRDECYWEVDGEKASIFDSRNPQNIANPWPGTIPLVACHAVPPPPGCFLSPIADDLLHEQIGICLSISQLEFMARHSSPRMVIQPGTEGSLTQEQADGMSTGADQWVALPGVGSTLSVVQPQPLIGEYRQMVDWQTGLLANLHNVAPDSFSKSPAAKTSVSRAYDRADRADTRDRYTRIFEPVETQLAQLIARVSNLDGTDTVQLPEDVVVNVQFSEPDDSPADPVHAMQAAMMSFRTGIDSPRSEERRVGKECRIGCRSRWSPYH